MNSTEVRWLSCRQVARRLDRSVVTVRRMIKKGVFVSRLVNNYRWEIREDTLERCYAPGPSRVEEVIHAV